MVYEYTNALGHIPFDENDAGGFPVLAAGTPYADSDHDGMSDVWELMYGLNPNDSSDGNMDLDSDGYTNVEEFLNATDPGTFTGLNIEFASTLKNDFIVYPNPANDYIMYKTNIINNEKTKLIIYNLLGKAIHTENLPQQEG